MAVMVQQLAPQLGPGQIAQLLFEHDRASKALAYLAQHDAVAAGILAGLRLRSLSWFSVAMLPTFEQKSTWDAATGRLNGIYRSVEQHPEVTAYSHAHGQISRFQDELGGNPDHIAAHLRSAVTVAEGRVRTMNLLIGVSLFGIVVCVLLSAVSANLPKSSAESVSVWGGLSVMVLFVSTIGRIVRGKVLTSARSLLDAHTKRVSSFLAGSNGGSVIQQVMARHPALTSFDPMRAPIAEDGGPVSARVIERQVLVQRCKYCGQMTAIDLAGCSHCGAKL